MLQAVVSRRQQQQLTAAKALVLLGGEDRTRGRGRGELVATVGDPPVAQPDAAELSAAHKRAEDEKWRLSAYKTKMKLFGIFLVANVLFLVIMQLAPSIVVQCIFLLYIVLSALPKFIFGSLIQGFKPKQHLSPPGIQGDVENPNSLQRKVWHISASKFSCPNCKNEEVMGNQFCSLCGAKVYAEHPILVSACITVHHEKSHELDMGVRSFELSDLPFATQYLQLIYIIDGRLDRAGKLDTEQCESARFLLARLHGLVSDPAAVYIGEDGVIMFAREHHAHNPTFADDGTAIYRGRTDRGSPFVVLLKRINAGKRHSHEVFFEYMNRGITQRTAEAVMFVDSDTLFSWHNYRRSLAKLYRSLMKNDRLGGVCGEIEVLHWRSNPVTITQYFEYKSNQFLSKTAENWFGMVTCLPGAFCMVRPQAMEQVLNEYLSQSLTLWQKNQLDLGEDRTLTTLLLQRGWDTGYCVAAVARTDVPRSLVTLVKQRRRWINSTIVNMTVLVSRVHRPLAIPLLISLAIELASSLTLPTAVLMLFFEVGTDSGVLPGVVLGCVVLWSVLLVTLSLTTPPEHLYWLFHGSALVGACVVVLMCVGVVMNAKTFFARFWLELVILIAWVFVIVAAALIHRQWLSVLGVIAPVTWLLMTPVMYVVVPVYAVCNFDDVSWGTRTM
eukprot:TRINITY_DN7720_c0_g1_i1.p1 TRINITY_DN7720_c0_g1~~TRINITY_DN7720_c0_g1_i1.p1  ORF type:complete len:670 (-),score=185.65 TRINITY_DN7720_c0_g1_i1:77-2086(-)